LHRDPADRRRGVHRHGERQADKHLRSADFFDVEKHPHIVVAVTGTGGDLSGDGLALSAEITVKGTTQVLPVTAAVTPATGGGSAAGSGDGTGAGAGAGAGSAPDTVRLTVRTVVDHRTFGIAWSPMGMMKPLTEVTVEAVFRRA
jgi:hypothetical protein